MRSDLTKQIHMIYIFQCQYSNLIDLNFKNKHLYILDVVNNFELQNFSGDIICLMINK